VPQQSQCHCCRQSRALFFQKNAFSFSCVVRGEIASRAASARLAKTYYAAQAAAASEPSRALPTLEICMLIIMHIFSIMLIMQIVKRHGEKNGLFAGTEG
jgi:hypothetical protein